ncbi:MAG: DUF4190 domain-containing protein [Actinomycetes bacterium]
MSPQLPPPPPPAPSPQPAEADTPQYQAPVLSNGPSPYGPSPYGPPSDAYPGGPHLPAQPLARPSSGLAITSFVLGLVALLLCVIPVVGVLAILLAIAGAVLGAVALSRFKKGTAGGKGLGIAGLVMSVLAFLGGVGSTVVWLVVLNEAGQAIEQSAQDASDAAADKGVVAAPEEVDAAVAALPLGQSATVGDYTVAITAVNTNANEIVAQTNQFNEPPTNQYVLVDVAVTYNGAKEGDPWIDLGVAVQGSDARQYDDTSCGAVLPKDATDVPTLIKGGQAEMQFCMDVPPAALENASLFVEQTFTFEDTRVYWKMT